MMFHFSQHQHKFSPTYLSCVSVVFFSEPGPVVHASLVEIHGRMALLRNAPPPQVVCPRGSGSKDILVNPQNQNWQSGWNGGHWSKSCPTANHSVYDFGSKTNKYVRCYHHHCTFGNERKNGETRGYHSERESFVTGFSRDLEVSVKLDAVFSCQSESTQNTRERIAVLPDKVACNRPLRHTSSCWHGEGGTHEDEGWWKPKGTLDSESTAGCIQKRSRNTVNKMYANDGSSTSPAQEVSHTLTDILESPGQALHFSCICSRGFDGSLSRLLRGTGPCFWSPSATEAPLPWWLWWRARKCNRWLTCGTARRSRAGRQRERKGGRDVSFDDLAEVKSRIAVCKNTWRIHQNTFYWCILKLAQKKRIAVLSNTIPHCRSFQITSRDLFWESGKYGDWIVFLKSNYTNYQGYRES